MTNWEWHNHPPFQPPHPLMFFMFWLSVFLVFFVLFSLFFFGLGAREANAPADETPKRIGVSFPSRGISVLAEVADTAAKRSQGLSGRKTLEDGEGMWFVFEQEAFYGFWMKDMNFAIDIIWLDHEKRIVDFWRDASPDSYPRAVSPKLPAKYVLEVPVGFVQTYSLAEGDSAEITEVAEISSP